MSNPAHTAPRSNINQEEIRKQIENNTVVLYNLKDNHAFYAITPEEARFVMDAIKQRRENHHYCQIVPLMKQNWWNKMKIKKGIHMFIQNISNLQLSYKDYYAEESVERRGGISNENGDGNIFDIAINIIPEEGKVGSAIKDGFLNILKEQIYNALTPYKYMTQRMKNCKIISDEEYRQSEIELWEVGAKILWNKKGVGTSGFENLSEEEKKEIYKKNREEDDKNYNEFKKKVKEYL